VKCDTSKTGLTVGALYTLSTGPTAIASDTTNFYWSNENAGTFVEGPIGGGVTATLLSGLSNPVGIAIAMGSSGPPAIFYSEGTGIGLYNDGTTSTCISGMTFPYFISSTTSTPPDGGVVTTTGLSVAASDLLGDAVYLAPSSACGATGGSVTIATGVPGPDTAATDGNGVFFGTRGDANTVGALYACPVSGCNPVASPTPYAANQGSVGRVVLDGSHVIWTASNFGLVECAKTGCTKPTVISSSFTNALQAQGGIIYYVVGGTLYGIAE
jgi:hypothetical protein